MILLRFGKSRWFQPVKSDLYNCMGSDRRALNGSEDRLESFEFSGMYESVGVTVSAGATWGS